jgi:transcriptional regulator with XRE-family HTH domain
VVDPKGARSVITNHFSGLSEDEFLRNVRRYCPELMEKNNEITGKISEEERGLVLIRPRPTPLRLSAYLASALTGLAAEQRDVIFSLSDTISAICDEHGVDLYEPRKATDPVHHAQVADSQVFKIDRERVLSSDLLIHLCHFPSTGAGEELDFAYSALVPIVLISHGQSRVSRMITGIPSLKILISYTEPDELSAKLHECLLDTRPLLEQRKMAFSKYDENIVGNKIRMLREELGLTREDVVRNLPHFTVDHLQQLEESSDRLANPSLLHLRQLATVLKTTVADLAEPDLNQTLIVFLQDWVEGRAAARYSGMTIQDRNRLVRRLLLRVIDSLETK